MFFWFLILFSIINNAQPILKISSNVDTTPLGGTIEITVTYTDNIDSYTVWPFVNNSQWGSDQPLMYPESTTILIIPFPHVGEASCQVVILKQPYFNNIPWTVGQPLPSDDNIIAKSNILTINVVNNNKYYLKNHDQNDTDTVTIMYWEPWFTKDNIGSWIVEEAIPIVGRYDSFNKDVMKQHILWFNDININAIGIDWTNNIWNDNSWDDRGLYAQYLINATTDTLQYYNYLKKTENIIVPKFVLLLGLDNGPKTTYNALNGEIQWITDNYWLNQNISDLFIIYEDKPLLIIFDGGNMHDNSQLNDTATIYNIKWMSSQFQSNNLQNKGFYSWMDGTINPLPTYVNGSTTEVEALTITTAFFPSHGGWFNATGAYPTNNGATLLEEGLSAIKYKPHFLFICQWNEFAGQANSNNSNAIYVDIYNSTLGNDIEPTSLTQCGYDRPNNAYCGGWGFRQINILNSIIYLLSSQSESVMSLFIVISSPVSWKPYSKTLDKSVINIEWVHAGQCNPNNQYVLMINLDTINIVNITNNSDTSYELNIQNIEIGEHILDVIAPQCHSAIDFSYNYLSPILSGKDMLVTMDSVQFTIQQ